MKKENAIHICAKSCCVSMGWTKGHLTYICTTWKFNSKARCRHRMAEDNNDDSSSGSAGNHQQQLHSHFFFVVFCVYCSLSLAVHFVSVSGDRHPGISFFLVCKPLAILIWLAHFIRFSIFFLFSDEMHVIFVAQCIHTYTKFIIAHNTYSTLFNLLVTS